jgi:hypothetical protein
MSRPTGNPRGRPSLLRDPARSAILTAIRLGHPYCHAARVAGVSYETVRSWMRHGEIDSRAGTRSEFASFSADIKRARAKFVDDNLKLIKKGAKTHWQAAAWLLERRESESFALNSDKIRELLRKNAETDAKLERILTSLAASNPPVAPNPTPEA